MNVQLTFFSHDTGLLPTFIFLGNVSLNSDAE